MAAFKALINFFGLGKHKEDNKKAQMRTHPYDEVSDAQLEENRTSKGPPRSHPYDEVSDDQLDENRQKQQKQKQQQQQQQQQQPRQHPYEDVTELQDNRKMKANAKAAAAPVRRHNYDEVDLDRTDSKVGKSTVLESKRKPGSQKGTPGLHYVEVDLQPSSTGSDVTIRPTAAAQHVIYSEVRPSTAEDLRNHPMK